jgi:type IV fimbrial biogenesis protein FimT
VDCPAKRAAQLANSQLAEPRTFAMSYRGYVNRRHNHYFRTTLHGAFLALPSSCPSIDIGTGAASYSFMGVNGATSRIDSECSPLWRPVLVEERLSSAMPLFRREFDLSTPTPGHRCAPRRRAVTIIELVVVVMVMGIMAAVAAPAFFETLLYHRVESAARRLKADLQLARQTARLTSATQSLTFTGTSYTLSAAIDAFDNPGDIYAVNLAAEPYGIPSVAANFNNTQVISFNGHGVPSSGGTVVLQLQGHQCTLTVNAVTGDVTVSSIHAGS